MFRFYNYTIIRECINLCLLKLQLLKLTIIIRKIVRVIKSRRMRWAGHVAREGEESGGV